MQVVRRNKNTWALRASNEDIIELQEAYLRLTLVHDEFIADYKLYEFFCSNWTYEHKIIRKKRKEDYRKYFDADCVFYNFSPYILKYDYLEICMQADIPVKGVENMPD